MLFYMNMAKNETIIEYKELLKQLGSVTLPMSMALTPINLMEEKEKFMSKSFNNPQFKYPNVQIKKTLRVLTELATIKHIEGIPTELETFLKQIIKSKVQSAKVIASIGNDRGFSDVASDKYAVPKEETINKATRVLRGVMGKFNPVTIPSEDTELRYTGEDVARIFKGFMRIIGVKVSEDMNSFARTSEEYTEFLSTEIPHNEWRIMMSKYEGNAIKVGSKFRVIFVPKDAKFSKYRIRKLLVHEIGTHVLRSVNGFETGYEFLGKPTTSQYLYTEEGLTGYNEMIYGILTRKTLIQYALLSYNVYLSHVYGYSFRQLYNLNLTFLQPKEAFSVAYKIKRGLCDTSKPGGYTKDAVYFKGFLLTRSRLLEGGDVLYRQLYAGKIPFKMVYLVNNGVIPKPKYVPDAPKIKEFLDNI